jgi:hypothetical protein
MARHFKTLGDLQGHLTHLEVRGRRCERRGVLRLDRLIARYGANARLMHLRTRVFPADCPRLDGRDYERCNVGYPQLVKLVLGVDYEE